jgi:hypothetical protein
VVRVEGRDHFCLFLRDAHPAGWNIANGGANDLQDLLRPASIIERELREELIVLDPDRRLRYVFDWHDAHLRDHPDFALADRLWRDSAGATSRGSRRSRCRSSGCRRSRRSAPPRSPDTTRWM